MHDIKYTYNTAQNRLKSIAATGLNASSYQYDKTGNLTRDNGENLTIEWNATGKVRAVNTSSSAMAFDYSPLEQRQIKNVNKNKEYYIHDATGNVMAIYHKKDGENKLTLTEEMVYGSSRLGSYHRNWQVYPTIAVEPVSFTRGLKYYELSNHLGNVNTVISDRKLERNKISTAVDYYIADIKSYVDYYPFGYQMPERNWQQDRYRYGFNGQEKDDEIYGEGNSTTAEFWQYDTRLGRRWNVDPKPNLSISSYTAFGNNPIIFCDPSGDTLRTDGSEASNIDIRSIAGKYSDIVSISPDHQITLNFDNVKNQDRFKGKDGVFSEKKFSKYQKKALRHSGVRLINDMSIDKLNYFYAATLTQTIEMKWEEGEQWSEYTVDLSTYSGSFVADFSWFNNVSTTPRGTETNDGTDSDLRTRPANGYDRTVFIAPGNIYTKENNRVIQIPRASYVFHELQENYYRTHYKMKYSDAHISSIYRERGWFRNLFNNPTPGQFYQFKFD